MDIPNNFKLAYSQHDITRELKRIGGELSVWMKEISQSLQSPPIIAPIMRGGIFAAVDLMREVAEPFELGYVIARSYQREEIGKPMKEITIDSSALNPKNRAVILVDEICDSGRTLQTVKADLIEKGAAEVRSVSLIVRRKTEEPLFLPDYYAFLHDGDEWFVGYGMQQRQLYRQLRDIYSIEES